MMECPHDEPADSPVAAELLRVAIRVVQEIMAEREPELDADLAGISRLVEAERLGVSTAAIAAAARRRGIPVRRIGGLSMLRLGYGCYRRLVCAALTEQTSAVGVDIASDKVLTKQVLTSAGIPVPEGMVARSPQEAVQALEALGGPVVIKPRNGNHGGGVTVSVTTAQQAADAYAQARAAGAGVLVETFIPGLDYRVLVVDGQVVGRRRAAARRGDRRRHQEYRPAHRAGPRRPAARAGGTVVLNAGDPATAALAERPAVRRHEPDIRYFSLEPDNPVAAAPARWRHQLRGDRRPADRDRGHQGPGPDRRHRAARRLRRPTFTASPLTGRKPRCERRCESPPGTRSCSCPRHSGWPARLWPPSARSPGPPGC